MGPVEPSGAPRAAILGCSGERLTPGEAWFFAKANPWGFILFARNCRTREQVAALVRALRACVGRDDAPVLIDQEGGRVARLKPPEWPEFPAAGLMGALYAQNPALAREAVTLHARLLAHELRALGITVDCVPVLDVPAPEEHGIIGDRAYGASAAVVSDLAAAAGQALIADGVLPVIKHIPGHGRARVDSHENLPVVTASRADLEAVDFEAFRAVRDMPLAMTAHVVYEAIDPERPATLSPTVIDNVIRSHIGFDGLLMTDDLSMKALKGDFAARARHSLEAGCDVVLHCNADMAEMVEVVSATPVLAGKSADRAARALERIAKPAHRPFEPHAAWAKLNALLDSAA